MVPRETEAIKRLMAGGTEDCPAKSAPQQTTFWPSSQSLLSPPPPPPHVLAVYLSNRPQLLPICMHALNARAEEEAVEHERVEAEAVEEEGLGRILARCW
jgi:hypothetical protein